MAFSIANLTTPQKLIGLAIAGAGGLFLLSRSGGGGAAGAGDGLAIVDIRRPTDDINSLASAPGSVRNTVNVGENGRYNVYYDDVFLPSPVTPTVPAGPNVPTAPPGVLKPPPVKPPVRSPNALMNSIQNARLRKTNMMSSITNMRANGLQPGEGKKIAQTKRNLVEQNKLLDTLRSQKKGGV